MTVRSPMITEGVRRTPIYIAFAVLIVVGALGGIGFVRCECVVPPPTKPYLATVKLVDQGRIVGEWKAAERLRDGGETWNGSILWRWYQPDGTQVEVLVGPNASLIVEPSP